jgi:DNA-binding HxlR family transcriptional regulator
MTRVPISSSDAAALNGMLMAVRQGSDVICDRWALSLVIAAFLGDSRFAQFMKRTGLASRLATTRLRMLVEQGIMVKLPYSIRPLRHEYLLTNMGRALFDVVLQMVRWEQNWRQDDAMATMVEQLCGRPLKLELRCRACGEIVSARDIQRKISRAELQQKPAKQSLHRRSIITGTEAAATPGLLGESLDVFGDKWGIEILVCAFTGLHRFNDFRAATGISANILSDRLGRLVAIGILDAASGEGEYGYKLTRKGIDTYGVLVTLQDWSDAWLSQRYRSPVILIHKLCGKSFHVLPATAPPAR